MSPGSQFPRPPGEFAGGDGARHHHIGEKQIHLGAAFEQFERAFRILGALHAVTQIGQHIDHGGAHAFVILHHQDAFAAALNRLLA